ncbi:ATP-binding cassette domain-containing protein [Tianweitania sediminis]|uniref:ATP-binding cassette domain-containing protein n=1 Tax=Tianweitania sediminis TaxID=1502156 RepID=A0A8J7UJZ6_9HYPH|nr:ATP-binding cassette domain-containing protein [Tianweitania sediminis]MBP0437857.1 ATP-binding cassette domain-containing protein [Tianweitania sediminis]
MSAGLAVQLDNVGFGYGEAQFHFDALLPAGEITAIMGPSGSGKSTFLNLVAGFEEPHGGTVRIGGADMAGVPPWQRPVSMIFQENNLFAHLPVEKNVALGRAPNLKLGEADRSAVAQALQATGLGGKEKRLPHELSGGERQRVAIARALVRERPVLILDEPFASLGPALRAEMVEEVRALHRRRGMTILFVTHHPEDAERLADQVVLLDDGRTIATGPAQDFFGAAAPEPFRRYLGKPLPSPG